MERHSPQEIKVKSHIPVFVFCQLPYNTCKITVWYNVSKEPLEVHVSHKKNPNTYYIGMKQGDSLQVYAFPYISVLFIIYLFYFKLINDWNLCFHNITRCMYWFILTQTNTFYEAYNLYMNVGKTQLLI